MVDGKRVNQPRRSTNYSQPLIIPTPATSLRAMQQMIWETNRTLFKVLGLDWNDYAPLKGALEAAFGEVAHSFEVNAKDCQPRVIKQSVTFTTDKGQVYIKDYTKRLARSSLLFNWSPRYDQVAVLARVRPEKLNNKNEASY